MKIYILVRLYYILQDTFFVNLFNLNNFDMSEIFKENPQVTFFVDLFNLENFNMSEIFWEINILGVIGRVHFS